MQELQLKARTRGLSDEQADELGRLLAEAQGRHYSNSTLEFRAMKAAAEQDEQRALRQWSRWRRRRPLVRGSRTLEIGMTPVRLEDRDGEELERATEEARGSGPSNVPVTSGGRRQT